MIIDLNTSLVELYQLGRLSARTYNCLVMVGFKTLRDILEGVKPLTDLMKLRNMGKKCYKEIVDLLSEVSAQHNIDLDLLSQQVFESLEGAVGELLRTVYDSLFKEDTNVTRCFHSFYPNVAALHKAVLEEEASLLLINKQLSFQENTELRGLLVRFLKLALEGLQALGWEDKQLYRLYRYKLNFLLVHGVFSYLDKLRYFLSSLQRACLTHRYEELKASLSERTRNFLSQEQLSLEDMVGLLGANRASFSRLSSRLTAKMVDELFAFNLRLKGEFDRYWTMNDDLCRHELIRNRFSYLEESECAFIYTHYKQYGFYPRLFILYHYLLQSTDRREQVYSWLSGIQDGKKHTFLQVAKRLQLTQERIRQLANGKLILRETDFIRAVDGLHYEALLNMPYITAQSPEWLTVRSRENLPDSLRVFYALIKPIGEWSYTHAADSYEFVRLCGLDMILNREGFPSWDYRQCVADLEHLANSHRSKDIYVSIEGLLNGTEGKERESAASLIGYLVTEGLHLAVDSTGNIVFPQNFVDVSDEAYRILSEQGAPMSAQALFDRFKEEHPDSSVRSLTRFKQFLSGHAHIKCIGKSGRYGLDHWKGVFYGSIRDALVEQLRASDIPLHIDTLTEKVLTYYPNTHKRSVCCSLDIDRLNRFVHFPNGYYGLTEKMNSVAYQSFVPNDQHSFETRLAEFKGFVETHQRLPFAEGLDEERSLYLWYLKLRNGKFSIGEKEQKLIEDMLSEYDRLYPRCKSELDFMNTCDRFAAFVQENDQLPDKATDSTLAGWFSYTCQTYQKYSTRRRRHFDRLLNTLEGLGFKLTLGGQGGK